MSNERLMYGSIGAAILSGVVLLLLVGWISFYGWIAAGLIAGIIARGTARGFISALMAGVIVSIAIIASALFLPFSDISAASAFVGNAYLNTHAFPYLYALLSQGTVTLIKTVAVDYIAIPVVSGIIGGSLLTNGYYVVESSEVQAPAPAMQPEVNQAPQQDEGEEASKVA